MFRWLLETFPLLLRLELVILSGARGAAERLASANRRSRSEDRWRGREANRSSRVSRKYAANVAAALVLPRAARPETKECELRVTRKVRAGKSGAGERRKSGVKNDEIYHRNDTERHTA